MRTLIVAVIAAVAGFIVGSLGDQNAAPTATETRVEYRTIVKEVPTTLDLDEMRDVSAISQHDDELNYECTSAIQRLTDDPWMGIVLYIERYWEGDACAAYEHQVTYGWH